MAEVIHLLKAGSEDACLAEMREWLTRLAITHQRYGRKIDAYVVIALRENPGDLERPLHCITWGGSMAKFPLEDMPALVEELLAEEIKQTEFEERLKIALGAEDEDTPGGVA